jgi:GAF domain-containing protein
MKQLLFASLRTRLMLLVLLALLPILGLALYDRIVYAEIDRLAARDLGVLVLVAGFALAAAWALGAWFIFDQMAATLQQRAHEQKEAEETLRRQADELAAITRLSSQVTAVPDLNQVLASIARVTAELSQSDASGVYTLDANGILRLAASYGVSANLIESINAVGIKPGQGAIGRAVVERQPVQVPDTAAERDYPFASIVQAEGIRAILAVPMVRTDHLIGGIVLWHRQPRHFAPAEIAFLQAIAQQCVNAVENARLLQETSRRAEQLTLLYDAGLALNSILEPRAQLGYLFKIAMRALQADRAAFFRYAAARNPVQLEICVGYTAETEAALREVCARSTDPRSIIGWVIVHRLPLNLPDVSADPRYVVIDPQVQSGLWMPVEHEHQLLGVFGVLSTRQNAFPPEAERLLALFANQAAVALEKARLFTEAQSSLLLLTRLYKLSSEVLTATTGQEIAQLATQALCDSFAATAAWIHLFDAHGTREFSYGMGIKSPGNGDLTPRPDGFSILVWRSGQPMIVTNPALLHPTARAFGTQSAVVLPLRSEPTNLGVLGLNYRQSRPFSEREIELLSLFANQVALAIKRVRLTAETRRRIDHLAVLNRIASAVNQTPRLDELLEVIYLEITAALPCDALSIALYDPTAQELDFRVRVDQSVREQPIRRPLGAGLSSHVVLTQKPLHIRDWEKEQNDTLNPIPWGTMQMPRTWLGVPMKIGAEVVGIISIQSYRPHAYDNEEEQMLVTIADQVTTAIQQARLFEETQQRLVELETMNEMSTALRAARTVAEMVPLLLDATLGALGATSGAAILYDSGHNTRSELAVRGWLAEMDHNPQYPREGITGRVLTTGEPYVSREFKTDPLSREEARTHIPPGWGGICAPIQTTQEVIGVLIVSVPLPRTIQPGEVLLVTTLAEVAGNAIHRATLHEQTERHIRRLNALHAIDTAISASLDLRVTLNILLDQVVMQLCADAADVLLLNPALQTLEYAAGRGFQSSVLARQPLRPGEGYPARAVLERKIVRLETLPSTSGDSRTELLADAGFVTYYAAPLLSKGQLKGVLEIFLRAPLRADAEWLEFLGTLAGQTAIALENAALSTSLQRSNVELALAYDSTIEGWSRALDLREEETGGHTLRVAETTVRLARALGVSERRPRQHSTRRVAARHRQDGDFRSHLAEERRAELGGNGNDPQASAVRVRTHVVHRVFARRGGYPVLPPRKVGRHRLSARLERGGDSTRRADLCGSGCVGRAALRATLSSRVAGRSGKDLSASPVRCALRSTNRRDLFADVGRVIRKDTFTPCLLIGDNCYSPARLSPFSPRSPEERFGISGKATPRSNGCATDYR